MTDERYKMGETYTRLVLVNETSGEPYIAWQFKKYLSFGEIQKIQKEVIDAVLYFANHSNEYVCDYDCILDKVGSKYDFEETDTGYDIFF